MTCKTPVAWSDLHINLSSLCKLIRIYKMDSIVWLITYYWNENLLTWCDSRVFIHIIGLPNIPKASSCMLVNSLLWRHNGRGSVSNHQSHDCLLNRLFRRRWKKASKFSVTALCAGNSPGTGEFPAQMASNAGKSFHLMTSACFTITQHIFMFLEGVQMSFHVCFLWVFLIHWYGCRN